MKNHIQLFIGSVFIGLIVVAVSKYIGTSLPLWAKWVVPILATAAMLSFLDHYFWVWAKVRLDMYVTTNGDERSTFMHIRGTDFLVGPGQELVIRQKEGEPGKIEVFTGKVESDEA